jgi:hypothetical protein
MTWQRAIAILTAVGAIAGACSEFTRNYSVEIHLVPIWGVDEPLPERLLR